MPQQNIKCWQWGSLKLPSKFKAYLGFSQAELDKVALLFPEINNKTNFPTVTTIMQYLLKKVINKELTESHESDDLDDKLKKQQLLKITLQNWNLLKEFPSNFEQKIAIIMLKHDMVEPQLEFNPQPKEKGFDQFYSCFTCHHRHSAKEPHVCTLLTCNCGVRG